MHKLYEIKEMLNNKLEEYAGKSNPSVNDIEMIDTLSHALKNICKVIEDMDEEYSGNYGSYRGGRAYASYEDRGGRSYARGNGRGRGTNARRDSMGRYSSDAGMIEDLRELMEEAEDEQTRKEFQRFISKIETM